MFDKLSHITLSGVEYPLKCDLLVLERIQDEFGTIGKFEDEILNWKITKDGEEEKRERKIPSAHAVNFALPIMINEGIEIENEEKEEKRKTVNEKEILRKVDLSLFEIAGIIHAEFARCFKSKNRETTQNQTTTEMGKK